MSEGELAREAEEENERKGPRRDFTPGEMRGGSILGHPVRRVEDPRFLTGQAQYTEDLPAEGGLHAAFVRSSIARRTVPCRALTAILAWSPAAMLSTT